MCSQFIKNKTTLYCVAVVSIQVDTAAVTTTQAQHSHYINYGSLETVSFEVRFVISCDSYSARDQSIRE